jgi:ATP-binding protein involved in chromosome partitioning
VASGKGGVGKTTVTVNLALALQRATEDGREGGLAQTKVGIFDADMYGPNVPLMLGIHRHKPSQSFMPVVRPQSALPYVEPLERFGLKLMSVGLLMAEDQVINPPPDAVGQLVVQTLKDVIWGELDYLLIDLPPSAGQPQEDLLKRVPLQGVIIVTTPQDLSLLDASRSLLMFRQAGVSILGIVENMSYFICSHCEQKHEIFQRSERWQPPSLEDVPVIGRIPLTPEISRAINRADPLMHGEPASRQADDAVKEAFMGIAAGLHAQFERE